MEHYDIQDKNVLKDVKTVTAELGALSISTACKEACAPGGFANRLNDFSQKLYEVIDSLGQDNEAYGDMQSIAEEFETTFKPWLSTSISKQSIIDLMPLPRTTIKLQEEKKGDNEDSDDVEEDSEEEENTDDDGSDVEEDDGSKDQDEEEDDEEETSVDNVDAVANKWDEKEHNRVVQGDKDEQERLQGVENQEEDLSEEEEDDGTTVSDDEDDDDGVYFGSRMTEEESDEEEVADPETSSEELVVCEMEDEEGNALEYLTNDPNEMNGDIFELLDGDEVGKKIGRFVDGEPEFFD